MPQSTQNLDNLPNDYLYILDYILNYDPDVRTKSQIEDDVNKVEKYIDRETKKDNYSNSYEILEIKDEFKDDIEHLIKERFSKLYTGFNKEKIENLFEEDTTLAFELYNKARKDKNNNLNSTGKLNNTGELRKLQKWGFGFRREYLTTTDKIHQQFVFRSFPEDGKEKFIEFSRQVLKEKLEDFSNVDIWTAYVNQYLRQQEDVIENLAGFPQSKVANSLEKPEVQNSEITFIREEVKKILRERLQKLISSDTFYFSTLETLVTLGEHSYNSTRLQRSVIKDLESDRSDKILSYVNQLKSSGLILEKNSVFLITDEVDEIIKEIEERAKIESYPIRDRPEAQNILYDILGQAEREIKIIDKSFDEKGLNIIDSNSPNDVRVLALYSRDKEDELQEKMEGIIDPSNYKVRKMNSVNGNKLPHDRFIIIDNKKVWQVGHSLNGIGNGFSTIFSHSEEENSHYITLFDNLWENAENKLKEIE